MRTVCATAANIGDGSDRLIGCRQVTIAGEPFGNIDAVTDEGGSVRVQGWALDPDTADPIPVHLYVDGGWGDSVRAETVRFDIALAYPAFGALHGFDATLDGLAPGEHEVCAYGINRGPWAINARLACRTVTVAPTP